MYNFDNLYNYDNAIDATFNNPVMSGLFIGIVIFSLILCLIGIISYWKVFTKASKPGWAIFIPIYNIIVMLQVAEMNPIYILLFLIPIANIIVLFMMNIKIAKRFGKSTGFGVGMSLLSIIFIPILAFSDKKTTNNNSNSNEFDAMNVINDNANNTNEANIEQPITEAPVINIETESTNDLSNNVETNVVDNENIEPNNNIVEQATTNNEIVQEIPTLETIDNLNNQESTISSIEPNQEDSNINEIPVIDNENINSSVENIEPINAFNRKPIGNEINTVQNNEINNNTIIDNTNNPITNTNESVINENEQIINAFNSTPTPTPNNSIESTPIEQNNVVLEPTPIENINTDTVMNSTNDKKVCKSCGTEMPGIVSICPNCGTDNE